MKNRLILVIVCVIIIVLILVWNFGLKKILPNLSEETSKKENYYMSQELIGKKALTIIAFRDFRDAEYFVPKAILENTGVEVSTASNQTGTAIGANGGEATVDSFVASVNPADFDAIIFIGGPGALKYLDNENSYRLVRETVSQGKLLASICISPVILAKAGVLEGKRATVWSSIMDKSAIKTLERYGANYEDKQVVVDGKIITANGPDAAEEFGKEVARVLTVAE